jgi:hypothetical protein
MNPEPKITWLARGDCDNLTAVKGTELTVDFGLKRLVVFKFDKDTTFDEVGIFKAENWEGCKEGYGGFFFGIKK